VTYLDPVAGRQRERGDGEHPAAGAPTSGGSGTFAGQAPKGALLVDTVNAKLYINTGTQAAPTWTVAGTQT
jgi:hypothetical protein